MINKNYIYYQRAYMPVGKLRYFVTDFSGISDGWFVQHPTDDAGMKTAVITSKVLKALFI